jgi:hypothetical protein
VRRRHETAVPSAAPFAKKKSRPAEKAPTGHGYARHWLVSVAHVASACGTDATTEGEDKGPGSSAHC